MFKTQFENLLHLFYPKICCGCSGIMLKNEEVICTKCEAKLPKTNFHKVEENPVEKIFWGRIEIEKAASFLFYEKGSLAQQLISTLKYNDRQDVGELLGEMYGEVLKENKSSFLKADCIIPVPLHFKKYKKRGYNQCDAIGRGLHKATKIPFLNKNLIRIKDNITQTGKNRMARWENVNEIFQVTDEAKLKNKHIVLIDDVVTTGATLEACATVIQKIEDTKISILTLACTV